MDFEQAFALFSKFGDSKSDGTSITLSNSDKWMKQAKVLDNKSISSTDTGICFKKLKQNKVGVKDYLSFLEDLAKYRKVNFEEMKNKMVNCGEPGFHGVGVVKDTGATARLVDTSKYTGSHKERFDASGKGKGKEGRSDEKEVTGYVGNYKGQDTYDKKN